MSDLISRSDLLKCFCVNKEGRRIPEVDCDNIQVTVSIKDIKRIINEQPTIEAVPVVYGRIIYKIDVPHCSVCGKVIHGESNYCRHCGVRLDCPECGARMKGGE